MRKFINKSLEEKLSSFTVEEVMNSYIESDSEELDAKILHHLQLQPINVIENHLNELIARVINDEAA